jgi:hypothetical protein
MELRYRYSILDKVHEYQINNDHNHFNQWVWYYLGQKIKAKTNESFLPYLYCPTKILVQESNRINLHAAQVAEIIVKAIRKHRKLRRK